MYAKASTCDIKQEILQLNGSSKAKISKASRYVKLCTNVYSYIMYLYVKRPKSTLCILTINYAHKISKI